MKTFEELGVSEEIRRAIAEMGFEQPMPVQEEVIPYLLGTGNDVIALAQTGTGKTAAYGLPIIQKIDTTQHHTQALVICPTRELCLQIADDLRDFSRYVDGLHITPIYGGAPFEPQVKQLRQGAQIIVATPGRLIDMTNRGVAHLDGIENVVLDEADEMLNMGFSESIDEILQNVPENRNTLLFSATMSKEIEKIAKRYLGEYKEIVVGSRNEGAENVNHIYYMVNAKDKYLALKRIVDYYPKIFAIIFCRTKAETQEIADKLIRDGYNAEPLHGDLSQAQRDLTMQKFRQHTVQLLVATDVAARGLDVDDLTHVINYGMPDDIENYTHRSGRTGRAGKKGTSICIVHSREKGKIKAVEKEIKKDFVEGELPTPKEICTKQLYRAIDKIEKTEVNDEQIDQFLPEIFRRFEYMDKEDVIKKVVSMTFNRFLDYYANAPEIEKVSTKGERKEGKKERKSGPRKAEEGYARLFINLGKDDGFYPGEVMQFINRHVQGRQQVGHIDLLKRFSYIEVPQPDARKVMEALDGQFYKGREVRCNDADQGGARSSSRGNAQKDQGGARSSSRGNAQKDQGRDKRRAARGRREDADLVPARKGRKKDDWRQFFEKDGLKGEVPDFSEEGWARRRPKKRP